MVKESNFQRFYKSLLETLIQVIGNTAGIWLTYIISVVFFSGIVNTDWQGLEYFLKEGSLLIISFSFLTNVLVSSYNGYYLNRYNVLAIILFICIAIIYAKHLGLNGNSNFGTLMWIPFIASIVLNYFALYSQRFAFNVPLWMNRISSSNATYKQYDIFIAFAIAANKNSTQRSTTKADVQKLENILIDLGYLNIFNAENHIIPGQKDDEFPPPADAAEIDFQAINNSKNFILYYPESTPTSAILELGYALKDGDNILIITPKIEILPFLVRGLPNISDKIKILEYTSFDYLENLLRKNHKSYFGTINKR
ncbi:MAG TPA: hypothetical protein PLQ57_12485 [Saprospiraceae bacterium]|mgnify:CR=1 FL=1|nr:hypothetical protein [Saprospiraceae bacterium]